MRCTKRYKANGILSKRVVESQKTRDVELSRYRETVHTCAHSGQTLKKLGHEYSCKSSSAARRMLSGDALRGLNDQWFKRALMLA